MDEPKPLALDYLLSVVRDPEADVKRRDSAAVAVASLGTGARREPSANNERLALRDGGGNGAKPAGGGSGFTEKQVRTTLKIMATVLTPYFNALDKRLAELERKKGIAPLAARVAGLEQRQMSYEGIWHEEKTYARGSFCTFQGGLWFCEDTNIGERPGAGSSSWKLAVKRGRVEK